MLELLLLYFDTQLKGLVPAPKLACFQTSGSVHNCYHKSGLFHLAERGND